MVDVRLEKKSLCVNIDRVILSIKGAGERHVAIGARMIVER